MPLAASGELTPDNDPRVGISDGVNCNQYWLVEHGTELSSNLNPCEIFEGSHDARTAPLGNPVAGVYVLIAI